MLSSQVFHPPCKCLHLGPVFYLRPSLVATETGSHSHRPPALQRSNRSNFTGSSLSQGQHLDLCQSRSTPSPSPAVTEGMRPRALALQCPTPSRCTHTPIHCSLLPPAHLTIRHQSAAPPPHVALTAAEASLCAGESIPASSRRQGGSHPRDTGRRALDHSTAESLTQNDAGSSCAPPDRA